MPHDEEFSERIDEIMQVVLDRLPDDQTIARADKGTLKDDVYLAVVFLAHLETGDQQAIADEFDKSVRDVQIDLFNAQHKLGHDGGFRTVVQSAGVHLGISTQKIMDALNDPPEAFVPH